jgi:dipeptidyl-peptidase 4
MKKLLILIVLFPFIINAQTKKITLEDIYKKGTFRAESIQGFNSMKDGQFYFENVADNIVKKSFETGETVETIIKKGDAKTKDGSALSLSDIEWSDDEKKILIFTDREFIYRRSSKAKVYVYDLKNKSTQLVDDAKILHATLSPDATQIAFVKENNLFIKNLVTNKTKAITTDGKWNKIINGNCDWVYEEEFSFSKAFAWSNNGDYLAYYKFNETKVPEFAFTIFDSLYPTLYSYKYPKAGDANSTIAINIYHVKTGKSVKADIGTETDIYIPRIKWMATNDKLCVYWLNRLQNHLKFLSTDANTGKSTTFYEELNKYYVDINDDIHFFKDGNTFLFSSEKDGMNSLYLRDIKNKTNHQLTTTASELAELYGVDETNQKVFYSLADNVRNRMPYCFDLKSKKQIPLSNNIGTHRINFNSNYSFFVDYYSTATTPNVISLKNTNKVLENIDYTGKILKDNSKLKNLINNVYQLTIPEYLTLKNAEGTELCSWILKPKDFDSSKKYPVLFCNYGGPGSQQVSNNWGSVNMWQHYLTQQGYIIVCVDNTGTGFRGEEFKKKTYLQLGKYEIQDQIDVAKYMATLPYVDGKRIGHWGWSYGGFMSSLAITKGADIFKTAIAVAPVTNWRYYDNIYTERFMRTPQENSKGYDDNSPINHVNKIKGNYLIIHGTADDNVHFQNSVMMIDEMIKKNIEFESAYYPNKNHGIRGGNTSFHLYNKMTKFILENL